MPLLDSELAMLSSRQNGYHARGSRSAQILREPDSMPRHLPLSCISAKLHHNVTDLAHPGRAHRMAFGFKTAARVDWQPAINRATAGFGEFAAFSFHDESQIFARH